jgi:hypothetical protein
MIIVIIKLRSYYSSKAKWYFNHIISRVYCYWLIWWYMPLIPALRRWGQEDCDFKGILGYIVGLCLKKTKKKYIYLLDGK